MIIFREPVKKKRKKNVENSTLGLTPPMTENVENFQKKKKFKKP